MENFGTNCARIENNPTRAPLGKYRYEQIIKVENTKKNEKNLRDYKQIFTISIDRPCFKNFDSKYFGIFLAFGPPAITTFYLDEVLLH